MEDIRTHYRALRQSVGNAVRAERQKQKLPLWKIEKQTGLSAHCIDQIELGKGSLEIDQLLRLSLFLGLDIKIGFKKQY